MLGDGHPLRRQLVGLDIFLGEADLLDSGTGSNAVRLLCEHLVDHHRAVGVQLTTGMTHVRAQRAYEKAGFRKDCEVLDLDEVGGERVRSWLMRWEPPASVARS